MIASRISSCATPSRPSPRRPRRARADLPGASGASGAGAPVGRAIAGAVGLLLLSGCLILPTDYYTTDSRRNLSPQITNTVRVGSTTREEMLLALGEPDYATDDGRRLGYRWSKVKWIWVVLSTGPGTAGGEVSHCQLLDASFDASNRLSSLQLSARWGDVVNPDEPGRR